MQPVRASRAANESPIIAVGTLRVPIERIEATQAPGKHEYVELRFEITQFLRGSAEASTDIRWYSEDRPYAPNRSDLIELNGKTVVAFLLRTGESTRHGIYFSGHTRDAVQPAASEAVERIKAEIDRQRALLAEYPAGLPEVPKSQLDLVRGLLDEPTVKGRAELAFERLLRLGKSGAPAMIALMDDRRNVAAEWLTVPNSPGHWEAQALYKPEKVVDAVDGILVKATGTGFVSIVYGESDENRRATVDAWRIYLYHVQAGPTPDGEQR